MLSPSARNTKRMARLVIRTQAVPTPASANGSTSSARPTTATPAQTSAGLPRVSNSAFMRALPGPASCPVRDPLAEEPRRPEHEHHDQHGEREHVLVVAAE